MKTFRAFGPTIGKTKLSKKIINVLNNHIDKSQLSKKNDYSSKLASQIKNEIKIPKTLVSKSLSKELIKNIENYLKDSKIDKIKEITTSKEGYSCGTGDFFVNKRIDMEVDVVDMEAYAIAKVCKLENIEFKCFKYISDNADKNADNDWNKYLALGATAFTSLINTQF